MENRNSHDVINGVDKISLPVKGLLIAGLKCIIQQITSKVGK